MTWKLMRNFMVVMMNLIILIIIEVQANELSSTFFHHSSLPISLRPSELDNNNGALYNCYETKFKHCEEKYRADPESFASCIFISSMVCAMKYKDDPMFEKYRRQVLLCEKKKNIILVISMLQNVSMNDIKV